MNRAVAAIILNLIFNRDQIPAGAPIAGLAGGHGGPAATPAYDGLRGPSNAAVIYTDDDGNEVVETIDKALARTMIEENKHPH